MGFYNDKIQNLHDLEYYGNIQLCLELAIEWNKLRPDNKEISALGKALLDISFYVNRIQGDLQKYKFVASEYQYEKNKAILELREIEEQMFELKKIEDGQENDSDFKIQNTTS